jgi:hypothetical protein
MADCQVTCITKPQPLSPHAHIMHLGNPPTWVWTREQVIASNSVAWLEADLMQ